MIKLEAFIIAFIICVPFIHCARMVPERANVTEINEDHLVYAKVYITRTSRKSPYFMNLEGQNKYPWGNNVTGHVYFYEYLHNEYRPSFVEMHGRICDLYEKDPLIGKMIKNRGVTCPVPARDYHLFNLTLPMQNFPYKFPFNKFRAEVEFKETNSNVVILKGYLNGVIENK